MEKVLENESTLRVRRKIKFREISPSRRGGVRLVLPGVNLATIGALILLSIHGTIMLTGGVLAADGLSIRPLYRFFGLNWEGLTLWHFPSLVTHAFLHATWTHVLLNALLFYYAASRLGHLLSNVKILFLFLVGTLAGAIGHSLAQAVFPGLPQSLLVGASGGVMGLLLAQTVIYPGSRMLFLRVTGRNMGKGLLVGSFVLFLLTPGLGFPLLSSAGAWLERLIPGLFQVGHLYHFCGGLAGLLLVDRLFPKLPSQSELLVARKKQEEKLDLSA